VDRNKLVEILNGDIESEHGAIVQYLTHAYAMGEGEVACEIEGIAREELRHLDRLAEQLVSISGAPRIEHSKVDQSREMQQMLGADISIENEVARKYDEAVGELADGETAALLSRIRDHELYHAEVFQELLDELKKGRP